MPILKPSTGASPHPMHALSLNTFTHQFRVVEALVILTRYLLIKDFSLDTNPSVQVMPCKPLPKISFYIFISITIDVYSYF